MFDHVLLNFYKSAYLDSQDITILRKVHHLYEHILRTFDNAAVTTVGALQTPRIGFDSQKEVSMARTRLLRDLNLCFLGHIPSLIRYLGGK